MLKRALILAIRLYQTCLSPILGNHCRFYPTCSQYAIDALQEYGLVQGVLKATWRIIRCNPFSKGGYDPVKKEINISEPLNSEQKEEALHLNEKTKV